MDGRELLQRYVDGRSPDVFGDLVAQYIDIVYASARRQVKDRQLAEDVTQGVFVLLSQKASHIPTDRPLSAWLLKTTGFIAANARRERTRRIHREHKAAMMNPAPDNNPIDDADEWSDEWNRTAPLLDEGIAELKSGYRDALLLRFFENRTVRQIGETMGISEDAAEKRVSRGVEQLRDFFRRRGVVIGAAGLATLLTTHSSEAAPPALAASAASAWQSESATNLALTKGGTVIMGTMPAKIIIGAAVIAACAFAGVVVLQNTPSTASTTAVTTSATQPATTQTISKLTFSDGTTAEFIGITEADAGPSEWWMPDGSVLPDVQQPASKIMLGGGLRERHVRFLIQYRGVGARDFMPRVSVRRIDPNKRGSHGNVIAADGNGVATYDAIFGFDAGENTCDLLIGLGVEKWTDILDQPIDGPRKKDGRFQLGKVTNDGQKCRVQLLGLSGKEQENMAATVVAITRDGREIGLTGITNYSQNDGVIYTFNEPAENLARVIYRTRPIEVMRIKNVSLVGGIHSKITVHAEPATAVFP
ncbi:MAG: sigma-70 family RNA polymerase sigma factor [Burkholderiales bacterium]|nr:sigma-70 family RNA polymerase sigma factor [Phycisphaerae bacterium]